MRLIFRLLLTLAGLIFLASLLAAGLLFFLLWLLRAAWARLTGRPVQPWVFQFKRQTAWRSTEGFTGFNGFKGFNVSDGETGETGEHGVRDVPSRLGAGLSGRQRQPADDHVIDVTLKEIK